MQNSAPALQMSPDAGKCIFHKSFNTAKKAQMEAGCLLSEVFPNCKGIRIDSIPAINQKPFPRPLASGQDLFC